MKCVKRIRGFFFVALAATLLVSFIQFWPVAAYAANADFAGGSGTAEDPYLIATKEQLNNVRNDLDAHYRMIADIMFSETDFSVGGAYYSKGRGWTPIGVNKYESFTGSFDGNGHCIEGLRLTRFDATEYAGLFGWCDGIVKNLGIKNSSIAITASDSYDWVYAGGIAGCAGTHSRIVNCWNASNVAAYAANSASYSRAYAGGIVGIVEGEAFISSCFNNGYIYASASGYLCFAYSGGIVGALSDGGNIDGSHVINCYNTGNVKGDWNAGGIAGCLWQGTVENCYNIGVVLGDVAGAIAGEIVYDSPVINCYYLDNILKGIGDGVDTTIKCSTGELQKESTFSDWDFRNIWQSKAVNTYKYPTLRNCHSWDKGTIIKQATCAEEGVLLYTCTFCEVTKTEPIAKTSDHEYGSWAKINDSTHKRTCSVCKKEETASHTWDSGRVTKQPTCAEEGVRTYTCSVCKGTKTEPIAKTSNHKYGSWIHVNEDTHKRTCSVCTKEETASHTWDSGRVTKSPTCAEEGVRTYTCSVCKGTKTELIAKTSDHEYGSWIHVNEDTHKRACSVCKKEETASHTWDSGRVTKSPTCAEEGVRSYTCTVCKGTKTEPIAKTSDHEYGSWTKINDSTHQRTCSVCMKEETSSHAWDSGRVTKQPTCAEEGVRTYTCTICNGTRTEPVSKTMEHTYENDCDEVCDVCGEIRSIVHNFSSNWISDIGEHWRECIVCGHKAERTTHKAGPEATAEQAQICTVCNYIITPALEHTHQWDKEYSSDADRHWLSCPGCAERKDTQAHIFDHGCDAECNICNYKRKTSHLPGPEATATEPQRCTECGEVLIPATGVEPTSPATNPSEPSVEPTINPSVPSVESTGPGTHPTTEPDDDNPNKSEKISIITFIVAGAAVIAICGVVAITISKKKR